VREENLSTSAARSGAGPPAGYEFVDHTSEVTMRLHAPSFPGLVAEATRAFAELVPTLLREGGDAQGGEWREYLIEAPDRAARLVGWLNEVIYLAEADQWLPVEVAVSERDHGMDVRARGVTLGAPFVLVKAATLHGASVRRLPEGLEAEVTLDV
jgi:SHS2 domain-containing protein